MSVSITHNTPATHTPPAGVSDTPTQLEAAHTIGSLRINCGTAACQPSLNAFNEKMLPMAVALGRKNRPDHTPTVLFQTRVDPEIRAKVTQAATTSGVSSGIYLEALLRHMLEDTGQLPALTDLIHGQPKEPHTPDH